MFSDLFLHGAEHEGGGGDTDQLGDQMSGVQLTGSCSSSSFPPLKLLALGLVPASSTASSWHGLEHWTLSSKNICVCH